MKISDKKREYIESFIRQAWDGFLGSKNKYFYNDRDSIGEIRRYMNGAVDIAKYKKIIIPEDLANEDTSFANINWKPLDIYTKYRRIAIQIIMAMKEEMSIDIIDSMAVDEKEDFFGEIMANLYMRDKLIEKGVDPSAVGIPTDLPESQKELEMFMEYSYKHVAAMEFETILKLIKSKNNYSDRTYKRLIQDLHDVGVCVTRDVEEIDGEILTNYVDPEFFFSSYATDSYFSDLQYAGEVKRFTLAECMRLTDDPYEHLKIDDVKQLMGMTTPKTHDYRVLRERLLNYQDLNSGHLNVIYCEFLSGETETYEIRTTKDGRKVFGRESSGKSNKEFIDAEYDCVYEGYWILGSDAFFGIKKKDNTLRDPEDVKRAKLTYHVTAAEVNHMHLNSIGKQVIPSIDAINIAWFKLQNAILKARPSGIAYDLTSLEAVSMGASGMSPEENIMTFNTSGNLAVRMIDEDGKIMRMPVEKLAGGLGSEGRDFMEQIQFNENLFRSITGMNELVDGSSPNPRTLKAVAQQASVATNNALKHIHDTAQQNELLLSLNIIQRIQDQAEGREIEFYSPAVGTNSVKFFKLTKDHSMRQLGLNFVPKPSMEEEERFQQALQLALTTSKGGEAQITIAQKAMLEQIDNKKYATMYLGYIVEKNIKEAREYQMQVMQQQAQSNQQAAMLAEEEKRKTLQMEAQFDTMKIDREWQWRMKVAELESSAKVTQTQIGSSARDAESMRMNETKVAIKEMEAMEKAKAEAGKGAREQAKS